MISKMALLAVTKYFFSILKKEKVNLKTWIEDTWRISDDLDFPQNLFTFYHGDHKPSLKSVSFDDVKILTLLFICYLYLLLLLVMKSYCMSALPLFAYIYIYNIYSFPLFLRGTNI